MCSYPEVVRKKGERCWEWKLKGEKKVCGRSSLKRVSDDHPNLIRRIIEE